MSVIYLLLPLSLLVAAGFVAAFVWAVRNGQLDDLETPGLRMLHDDVLDDVLDVDLDEPQDS